VRRLVRSVVVLFAVVAGATTSGPGTADAMFARPAPDAVALSVSPKPRDVVGVGHPLVVTFGEPVSDRRAVERFLNVTSAPARTGTYEWIDDRVVHWTPDQFWPGHATVALSVGGRGTSIKTGPAVIGIANIAEHTFTVTVDGVRTAELPAPHHRPRWGEPGVFPASMGRPEYPTPVGVYTVLAKERGVTMDSSTVGIPVHSPDGYLMRVEHAVRFTRRGLFVHDAPWAVNSLGNENVSHGCVGLSPEDAEWYFNTVNVGDPIIIRENGLEVPRPVTGDQGDR